jgi:hypothetical protein
MTLRALVVPRRLGRCFPNSIQQDLTCERLPQIGDATGVHRLMQARRMSSETIVRRADSLIPD